MEKQKIKNSKRGNLNDLAALPTCQAKFSAYYLLPFIL